VETVRGPRAVLAVLLLVLASVLLLVGVLLCVTVILLPLGVFVAFAAIRLFGMAVKLLLPRKADVERGVRKGLRVREFRDAASRTNKYAKHVRRRLRKRVRRVRRQLPV
jgi:hypothetical protein